MSKTRSGPTQIYLIHHSHTDIGYTELQSTITGWQTDFIRQALRIIATRDDFKWNCETFWAVEQFLKRATRREVDSFAEAVRAGRIGLSGSYLNLNELADFHLLSRLVARAADYGRTIDAPVDSSMTADINGFGWGFAQALFDNGINNLFTCIHTHHGMYPFGKRHIARWWETPSGDRILVWNGEHYHYGNELGLVPGAVSSYIIKDECDADMIFSDHWRVAEIRIPRFMKQMAERDYPYDFIPVMASGLRTDNGPPNGAIADCLARWNSAHGDIAEIRMVTLSEFFLALRAEISDLPVFRGDWPDWWSDGLASFPAETRLFRKAQRDFRTCRALSGYVGVNSADCTEIENNLALYAEHTFSHADSVSQPWSELTHGISARKKAYVALAREQVNETLMGLLDCAGAAKLSAEMPPAYRVVNPFDHTLKDLVRLSVGHFEFNEKKFDRGLAVRRRDSETEIPHQIEPGPGGTAVVVPVALQAGESVDMEIIPQPDSADRDEKTANTMHVETAQVRVEWEHETGLTGIIDRKTGRNLIVSGSYPALTPIYEITRADGVADICAVRGRMDRNRKGADVERHTGRLLSSEITEHGPLFSRARLMYEIEGCSHFQLELTAHANEPRLDVVVQMCKAQVWDPENLYLSLPFTVGDDSTLWLDKAGAPMRPRIDQLPGTLTDFYCLQDGLALVGAETGLALATPDSPLLHMGDLEYRERMLHDPSARGRNHELMFAWLMTNYWETNFAAALGGFYEFRYHLQWGGSLRDADTALQRCRDMNTGLLSFRLRKED